MNKILVEVSIGELLDKISILEIKQEKIKDPENLKIPFERTEKTDAPSFTKNFLQEHEHFLLHAKTNQK